MAAHIIGTDHKDVITTGKGDDAILAGPGDDLINSGQGDDTVDAGDGDDRIIAGKGDDTVFAGSGDDFVNAGQGDDVIDAGYGDDVVIAGAGDDIVVHNANIDVDTYNIYKGGSGDDTLRLIAPADVLTSALFLSELAAFEEQIALYGTASGFFTSLNVEYQSFESIDIQAIITTADPCADTEGDTGVSESVTVSVADHVTIVDPNSGDAARPYDGDLTLQSTSGRAPSGGLDKLFQIDTANGTITYDRAAFDYLDDGEQVVAEFTFKASSGPDTFVQTINLTIKGQNDAPVGVGEAYSVDEDNTLVVAAAPGVLANDSDVDGDLLTAAVVTGPAHGTLVLNDDGSFTYTPVADFNGADSFAYVANDGTVNSDPVTVNLTVNPVNDAPVGVGEAYSVDEDDILVIAAAQGVLANDSDVDGDPLTAAVVVGPAHGTLALNDDGAFIYTPAADFNGADSFTYVANDGAVDSDPVAVNLTVNPVNDEPVGVDDAYSVDENAVLNVAGPGVLANDGDADGDPLTAAVVTGPGHGTLGLNDDGSFTYTPDADFSGMDSFTYVASDGSDDSNLVTVDLTVNPVESGVTLTVTQAQILGVLGLLAFQIEGLAIGSVSAENGTIVDNEDGTYSVQTPDLSALRLNFTATAPSLSEPLESTAKYLVPLLDPSAPPLLVLDNGLPGPVEPISITVTTAELRTVLGLTVLTEEEVESGNLLATGGSVIQNPDGTWDVIRTGPELVVSFALQATPLATTKLALVQATALAIPTLATLSVDLIADIDTVLVGLRAPVLNVTPEADGTFTGHDGIVDTFAFNVVLNDRIDTDTFTIKNFAQRTSADPSLAFDVIEVAGYGYNNVSGFNTLDTNNDGKLDGNDTNVAVVGTGLAISFANGDTLIVEDVIRLNNTDFNFLP